MSERRGSGEAGRVGEQELSAIRARLDKTIDGGKYPWDEGDHDEDLRRYLAETEKALMSLGPDSWEWSDLQGADSGKPKTWLQMATLVLDGLRDNTSPECFLVFSEKEDGSQGDVVAYVGNDPQAAERAATIATMKYALWHVTRKLRELIGPGPNVKEPGQKLYESMVVSGPNEEMPALVETLFRPWSELKPEHRKRWAELEAQGMTVKKSPGLVDAEADVVAEIEKLDTLVLGPEGGGNDDGERRTVARGRDAPAPARRDAARASLLDAGPGRARGGLARRPRQALPGRARGSPEGGGAWTRRA